MEDERMTKLSGATQQSIAVLLDSSATHTIIESLFLRFEVAPLPADSNPNKLKKATYLVRQLGGRPTGPTDLLSLITYVGTEPSGTFSAFRRSSPEAADLYQNLDADLTAAPAPKQQKPERQFTRPGTTAGSQPTTPTPTSKRYVFIVRGRDNAAYEALAALLNALDLRIITWDDAARGVGDGTPHTLDIVRAGIGMADAVIVLMTPDDLGQVKAEFGDPTDSPTEASPGGQARQNVVFEAGWAMALNQRIVILVRVGDVRRISDIDGLNYVHLTGDISSRRALITRLRNVDVAVNAEGDEWRIAGTFPGQH
ncbi:TIR domain-containing protein [Lacisediminihabitans sp. H27-G8]|uniref:TIR domain-containing protein n=1 Tax=Lacisediminihabitans sp. H27-G8 TaxID=3111909 RepID=UPI0038FC9E2B